ncbi:Piso0_000711 [Millerozyma farinosa CBS 7064]|uniref:Piso0_000711 protein n=1 Tax=Pichia sorbitophila (strain ATCC MYA-4447 / BCRC 22081 / CBS 7064 / NBRC 10061 / NRRL Y-12695) TaxID=559304 RepID=G8YRB1_PICSO|nr:Piso0_000711 [Millerozyma farinosa CBS 7064]
MKNLWVSRFAARSTSHIKLASHIFHHRDRSSHFRICIRRSVSSTSSNSQFDISKTILQAHSDYTKGNKRQQDFQKEDPARIRLKKKSEKYVTSHKKLNALASKFEIHRNLIYDAFTKPENIYKLSEEKVLPWLELSQQENKKKSSEFRSYADIHKELKTCTFHYPNSEIANTLCAISSHLINSTIIELNLRYYLGNDEIGEFSDKFLFRNFIDKTSDISSKKEIAEIVSNFENNGLALFPINSELSSAQGIGDFKNMVLDQAKFSEAYNSIDFYRYNFMHFKTSKHLNYDHHDTTRFVQGRHFISFGSPERSNSEYIKKIECIFHKYANDKHPLKHINLALGIASSLLGHKDRTPTYGLLRYLMEKLGHVSLWNYQSIIYSYIPSTRYYSSALSSREGETTERVNVAYQFTDAVEDDPSILESLIKYQDTRNDPEMLIELLSFFKFDEVIAHTRALTKSDLARFISKSRFSFEKLNTIKSIVFSERKPLFISSQSLLTTIDACIKLRQFEYIDLLVNKLLVHSVSSPKGYAIALNFGSDETDTNTLLLKEKLSPDELASQLFNKDLFVLLLRACRMSDDEGRLMWLIPHLDSHIIENAPRCNEYLTEIRDALEGYSSEVAGQDFLPDIKKRVSGKHENVSIDIDFIEEIYRTISTFHLDGKLMYYSKILMLPQKTISLFRAQSTT